MDHFDNALAKIASPQFGVFTLAQFRTLAGTEKMLRTRIANGAIVRVAPLCYRVAGAPITWDQKLMGGLLSLGPTALVSHRSAAALHRFDGYPEGPLEFTVPTAGRLKRDGIVVHGTVRLDAIDTTTVRKVFRCTAASRTVLDLAATDVSDVLLEKAVDSAVRTGKTSPAFLQKRLSAMRGSGIAGARRVDHVLVDSGGHSPLERAFLRLIREAGLPRPSVQVIHRHGSKTFARVDFQFTPVPLVVEVSGRLGHVSDAERRVDAERRNELQSEGFVVLEFTRAVVLEHGARVGDVVGRELRRLAQTLTV